MILLHGTTGQSLLTRLREMPGGLACICSVSGRMVWPNKR